MMCDETDEREALDFGSFGDLRGYVTFFAERGTPIFDIAAALGMKVAALMDELPGFDFFSYQILPSAYKTQSNWGIDELKKLFKYYPSHGPKWDGWRRHLPKRTENAIKTIAQHLGIKYSINNVRKRE
jgi:hypothetical protein